MKLRVRAELVYRFEPPTDAIYQIEVAHWPGQEILEESLTTNPPVVFHEDKDAVFGARTLRAHLEGEVALVYEAVVENGVLKGLPEGVRQHDWNDLPAETLPYLLPSRYCPSDQFGRFVQRQFGETSGGERVLAILGWIRENIDYEHGVSDSETTAARTFIDRAGVCRDFTHLGMTLCRASGIPARAVSAYAHQLTPPDFHAIFEVYLDAGWWLVDPTGLAPIEGLVRIACGRDAADIAFLSTQGNCQMVRQSITAEAV
ncbi:transglutaminase-like domain-containing protein [Brevundimonas goettingensis]|jgi:transglutaminase-like putative cysteine protease|uniref:Transglutaminase family protein n=1 Tax=Brevundimonas goettingensis TaxID=2774190 RepID=A0A975C0K5_9CAUL|nr:transglutaminase family protein [Brevundimonas goettingensis]QTC90154.1 transglutaminase family protein [Brevundimonas goettingensis]